MATFYWDDTVIEEGIVEQKQMTRLEANRKIVAEISKAIEKYPDCRFCQILQNLNIEKPGCDNFYVESTKTLKDMKTV